MGNIAPAGHLRMALLGLLLAEVPMASASAQDAATTGEALSVPVFDSIDENGVDLITGMLRIRSPSLTMGSGDEQVTFGFEWTGRSWRMLGVPMINRYDGKYAVTYNGVTDEFNGRSSGFSQRKPITGSTLDCGIWSDYDFASDCMYINRDGDVVMFAGRNGPYSFYTYDYGMSTLGMGNLGMTTASVTSGAQPPQYWETPSAAGFNPTHHSLNNYVFLANQQLKITTPNQDGTDYDEHYLRPKNTIQTFIDDFSANWQYTVNGDREITYFQPPNGLAGVSYTYTSEHRVTSVTTAAGTWNYSYSSSNGYRTITVTVPSGRVYSVKSHIDNGYVVELRDGIGTAVRTTSYYYDAEKRLRTITYPELNRLEMEYDARGNIRFKRMYPKPSSQEQILTWEAGGYYPTCTERVLCNRPTYIIDPNNNRTDFEYASHGTGTALRRRPGFVGEVVTVDFGHGKPVVIRVPAALPNTPRPTVTNTYSSGRLASTSACITQETCAGTSDEVKTQYEYSVVSYSAKLASRTGAANVNSGITGSIYVPRATVESSVDGVHRTCYESDPNGRIVAETPPIANLTSCPTGTATAIPAYDATVPETGYGLSAPTFSQ